MLLKILEHHTNMTNTKLEEPSFNVGKNLIDHLVKKILEEIKGQKCQRICALWLHYTCQAYKNSTLCNEGGKGGIGGERGRGMNVNSVHSLVRVR